MSQYYYTVAALPMLFYDTPPGAMSTGAFIDFCSDWLSMEDFSQLKSASLSIDEPMKKGNPVILEWISWECTLRNELVKLRAPKKGEEAFRHMQECDTRLGIEELAREAFVEESPLLAEDILNRGRWRFLEELETGHHFDIERLIVYFLKLQLLERKHQFDKQKGKERYNEIFANITDYNVQDLLLAQK